MGDNRGFEDKSDDGGFRVPGQFHFASSMEAVVPARVEEHEDGALAGKITLHPLDFWVIDSGATHSMTPRVDLLTELEPSPVKYVTSALGQRAEVKGMGKAMFKGADGEMVGLKHVLWVPDLAANLISVRRLQRAGMDTISKGSKCYKATIGKQVLWDLKEERDVFNDMWQIPVVPWPKHLQVAASTSHGGEGEDKGNGAKASSPDANTNMQLLKTVQSDSSKTPGTKASTKAAAKTEDHREKTPKTQAAAAEATGADLWDSIACAAFTNPTSATGECDWLTLHRRMGHVALPILKKVVEGGLVKGVRVKGEPDEVLGCPTCMQAKFTRYPFPSAESTAREPLDAVVMDVVGPLKHGAKGAEYFLTIVDVYTRMTWVYVLAKKSEVAETVKSDWLPMVERQQNSLVKMIHTDRGGEFLGNEFSLWLKKQGIRHSLTAPYSPAMNGIAERANRTITDTARGLLIESGLPDFFWPDAVRHACVTKNRVLTHVGDDKWVPYVEWLGRKPKVDMLRVFGCMCMALVPKQLRDRKLGAKAVWAVHLGMAQQSKGWLLWDPFSKKFTVSRDCKFMEGLMYKEWKAQNQAKFEVHLGGDGGTGLEHVELPMEMSPKSSVTWQSPLVSSEQGEQVETGVEVEEVQQEEERAPTLPPRGPATRARGADGQQPRGILRTPEAVEEGRGKRPSCPPKRLNYERRGSPSNSALVGAALMVGEEEPDDGPDEVLAAYSPVELPGEPESLEEALKGKDAEEWRKALLSEMESIAENETWELVALPEGRKAITSKWLFKIKTGADGGIERYKCRLVAKGYQQKEGVDYKEVFAPVVKATTLRILLAAAANKGWLVEQTDVKTAFLYGEVEEEIFMEQPEGFSDGSGRVCKLKKSLYGLKQAPRQWYLKLREVLEGIGFTPSTADQSLFMLGEGEQRSFLVVYVDDILIFSPSSSLVKDVMERLQQKFQCKAMGAVHYYLGLHIERDVGKRWMHVHQKKYLEALAAKFGKGLEYAATPFASGFKCVKGPMEESVGEEERRVFHSLVGSLMYAAVHTRPDVAFATGQLARVVQCPNEDQVAAGERVARYLGKTATAGLQYSVAAQRRQKGAEQVENGKLFLTAFSDATWASEPEDMTSVGGYICCVGGGPSAWESKKQADQALSSVESEYMAVFRAIREVVWQRRLLAELGEEQQGPTPLYCDSQGAIALANNPVLHGLTKHMKVKWHWVRSMVTEGEVELRYVKSANQPADMMTKRLVEQQHWKCCKRAGMALN